MSHVVSFISQIYRIYRRSRHFEARQKRGVFLDRFTCQSSFASSLSPIRFIRCIYISLTISLKRGKVASLRYDFSRVDFDKVRTARPRSRVCRNFGNYLRASRWRSYARSSSARSARRCGVTAAIVTRSRVC